jgi:hypothetical protein
VALRTGLKCQVHAVLAKQGVTVPMSDLFGYRGQRMLEALPLDDGFAQRMESTRQLICVLDNHVDRFERLIKTRLKDHRGYQAIQAVPGVGPLRRRRRDPRLRQPVHPQQVRQIRGVTFIFFTRRFAKPLIPSGCARCTCAPASASTSAAQYQP